jgi:hypothetical protein
MPIACLEKDYPSAVNRIQVQAFRPVLKVARSKEFDLDNGSGTTLDDCILRCSVEVVPTVCRIVYTDATTGTVAGGNAKIGTTVGGTEVTAATAYENTKAVGTATSMSLTEGLANIAADTPIIVRHTGVAATQAGKAYVEVEYYTNEQTTVPLFRAGAKGAILDFVRIRYDTAARASTTATVRKIDNGTAESGSGTAMTSALDLTQTVATDYTMTITNTANQVGANQQVYLHLNQTPGALKNMRIDVGYRAITN